MLDAQRRAEERRLVIAQQRQEFIENQRRAEERKRLEEAERAEREAQKQRQAEERRAEEVALTRARVALAVRMLGPSMSRDDAREAATMIVESVLSEELASWLADYQLALQLAAAFTIRNGWKATWREDLRSAISEATVARRECEEAGGPWSYRFLGVDKKLGSNCGLKSFAEGLPERRVPEDPPEIQRLQRDWRGLFESVTACENGREPERRSPYRTVFRCPRG